jgi:4-hydroxy-2-oxoheptanedioate aldolase
MNNPLRHLWANNGVALNGWLHIPSGFSAEVMARAGYHSLTIDMQHGLADYAAAVAMLQGMSPMSVVPLARVPWNEPGLIMRMLDAGCLGIICPMINNRAEATAFVEACRYPPHGYRSYGPTRVALLHGNDYPEHAERMVLTFAMIETAEAYRNVEAIVTTPGLDAIYVGPADLSISLGLATRADFNDPALLEAVDTIFAAAQRHGIIAGIHTNHPAEATALIARGAQFVTIGSDAQILAAAARSIIQTISGQAGDGSIAY